MTELPPLLKRAYLKRNRAHAVIFVGIFVALAAGALVIHRATHPGQPLNLPWWVPICFLASIGGVAALMYGSAKFRLMCDVHSSAISGINVNGDICNHFQLAQDDLSSSCLQEVLPRQHALKHIAWEKGKWDVALFAGRYVAFIPGRFSRADKDIAFEACCVGVFGPNGWEPTGMLLLGSVDDALEEFVRLSMQLPEIAKQVELHGTRGAPGSEQVPTEPPRSKPDPFNPPRG